MLENTQIFVGQLILSYNSIGTIYKAPFAIANNILKLCQSIAKELGFLEGTKNLTPLVQLRKDNQITDSLSWAPFWLVDQHEKHPISAPVLPSYK